MTERKETAQLLDDAVVGDGLADDGVGVRHSAAILGCDLRQVNESHRFERWIRKQQFDHPSLATNGSGQAGCCLRSGFDPREPVHGELLNWAKIRRFFGF